MRKLIFLTLLLAAGCSKSPEPAKAPPKAAAAPHEHRRILIAFGDSLTAGFGVEPGLSYPDFLQKQLDAKNLGVGVVNAGVSGETTSDALARVDTILAGKPDIVVVEFGGNDGLRGLPVATTRRNLDQLLDKISKSGAKIVLAGMTLPPNYGTEYITGFEQLYRDLAKKYNATLIPFLLKGVGGNPDLMQNDGIHPNAEGNRIVGDTVFQYVQKVLG